MKGKTNMNQQIEDIDDTNYKKHINNKHPSKLPKKLQPPHNADLKIMDEVA